MKISILDRQNNLDGKIHEFAKQRVLFALSRFGAQIARVEVVLANGNGPRGGVDNLCSVRVKPRRLRDIRTSDSDADVEASIACAIHRAGAPWRAPSKAISTLIGVGITCFEPGRNAIPA